MIDQLFLADTAKRVRRGLVRYTGKAVWSRKHKIRDPKAGRRVFRSKEGELPVEGADCPHLRIVSDELWAAVEARREFVRRTYHDAGKRSGLMRTAAMNAPYMFSGLLRCTTCGSNLQLVSGRGRNHRSQTYGCPMNHQRGMCSNQMRVRRDVLERAMLDGLRDEILTGPAAEYVLDRFGQGLRMR